MYIYIYVCIYIYVHIYNYIFIRFHHEFQPPVGGRLHIVLWLYEVAQLHQRWMERSTVTKSDGIDRAGSRPLCRRSLSGHGGAAVSIQIPLLYCYCGKPTTITMGYRY